MVKLCKVSLLTVVIIIFLSILIFLILIAYTKTNEFDGQRAFIDVKYQVDLGPRIPGSDAHKKTAAWIISRLEYENF